MAVAWSVSAGTPRTLTLRESVFAIERLGEIIERRHALAPVRRFDAAGAIGAARRDLRDGMSLNELVLVMQRTLAPIGDGHTQIVFADRGARNAKRGVEDGRIEHLPFIAEMIGEKRGDPIVAFRVDREGFVDDAHPLLVAVDGVEIERWIDVIASHVPRGSPQFVRSRSLRELRSLWRWRLELGLEAGRDVEVTLSNLERTRRVTRTLRTRNGVPGRGDWPRTRTRMLEDNIGYLRVESMSLSEDELEEVRRRMEGFRSTRGLIVDVRGNGGGQRHFLHLMGEYLLEPVAEPVVYTAVRPRLVDGGEVLSRRMVRRMEDRHLYPEDSEHWSAAQREAIGRFRGTFRARLEASDDLFAPLHYAVLTPGTGERSFHYRSPVIVLMNADCFSATDVFLHAMGLLENVTLIGEPSAGSSGAPLSWETGIAGVSVRVSSMVSYRTDGTIFDDGRGEEPDVRIDPHPSFFIGGEDLVLDAAVDLLRR